MTDNPTRPFTAAAFQQYLNEAQLMGSHCPQCAKTYLPPRAICPSCQSADLEWVALSGKGQLAAFTSIYIAPTFMVDQGFGRANPYLTGIVALDEGPQISARILGSDATQPDVSVIGSPVEVEFLEQGEGDARMATLAFRLV